ncbi:hypothetical protein SFUMM280S_05149 [Streptomyces fumanus]
MTASRHGSASAGQSAPSAGPVSSAWASRSAAYAARPAWWAERRSRAHRRTSRAGSRASSRRPWYAQTSSNWDVRATACRSGRPAPPSADRRVTRSRTSSQRPAAVRSSARSSRQCGRCPRSLPDRCKAADSSRPLDTGSSTCHAASASQVSSQGPAPGVRRARSAAPTSPSRISRARDTGSDRAATAMRRASPASAGSASSAVLAGAGSWVRDVRTDIWNAARSRASVPATGPASSAARRSRRLSSAWKATSNSAAARTARTAWAVAPAGRASGPRVRASASRGRPSLRAADAAAVCRRERSQGAGPRSPAIRNALIAVDQRRPATAA